MIKRTCAIIIFLLVLFITCYLVWYQHLINKGSAFADNQCLIVNPLIIARKNSYLDSLKIIQASGSAQQLLNNTKQYIAISKEFVNSQESWLEEEKAFISQWDYKLFMPSYLKNLANAQYISREADVKATRALIDLFNVKDSKQQKELDQIVIDQTLISKKADDEYYQIWNSPRDFGLWYSLVYIFVKVPETKCPPQNLNIPSIPDFLNPTTIPINKDKPLS